jgi:hypothetical protein
MLSLRLKELPYTTREAVRTTGKKSVATECPFRAAPMVIFLWPIAGNGKKLCFCGAALHADGIARKFVEVTP